ncbi:DNA helicase-4 [Variovorax sp. OK212]|nr:DNA helicase-4 [Variovorax sp. OK202]SFE06265.1 DNA helicase-4 [Variovorax sp. OK212]
MLRVDALKPLELAKVLEHDAVREHLARQSDSVKEAVALWRRPFFDVVSDINKWQATQAAEGDHVYFDSVERSPLTTEQRDAVVCFDSRVLLVASAGSGKTSTMVAKAGYALKHGYFSADRLLLLAFNADAAVELRQRIQDRLAPLGLPVDKVVAKTFHAFGLDIIGTATGKRPSLAAWLDNGQDLESLLQMADTLKDSDAEFRTSWDMFRVVFGQDLPKFGKEQESPDSWDGEQKRGGFWTLNNEVVKSRGELVIANWLFYNGVRYVYEGSYVHDTATATHRQYKPDFFLPDANAYLEHWALDEKGEPPAEFAGYKAGMDWKRKLHADCGTTLLETTMADLWSGKAFAYLCSELTKRGISLDPNPDREVAGRKPIENPRLVRTFRSFLTHAKSNRLSASDLRGRLQAGTAGSFRFRHEMFLRLFEKLSAAWEEKLQATQSIDFEDMLNLATDCIESGRWTSPFELVMVDEFQDASQARARLMAGLMRGQDKYLFAVGDDWQSINRFAGADLGVMTDFEQRFGKATTLRLETTFRCPPSLCEISSTFVRKNPRQISKAVRSPKPDIDKPVRIIRVKSEHHIRSAIEKRIGEISHGAEQNGSREKVYVLGRYRKDSEHVLAIRSRQWVDVEFITVHSSKGLEADHIIIPRMTSETLGFPSRVADDPVLQLAMPGEDSYEYAEERRLFYVALTRARSTATLITIAHKESAFITELVRDQKLEIANADGSADDAEVCPTCGSGFLVARRGPYGQFLGCSTFPRCSFTRKRFGSQRA